MLAQNQRNKTSRIITELGSRCVKYVRENLDRFQEVDDGWKGESNSRNLRDIDVTTVVSYLLGC